MKRSIEIDGKDYHTQALLGDQPVTLIQKFGSDFLVSQDSQPKVVPISELTLKQFTVDFPLYLRMSEGTVVKVISVFKSVVAVNNPTNAKTDTNDHGDFHPVFDYINYVNGQGEEISREEFERIYNEAKKRVDADVFFEYDAQRLDKDDDEMNDKWHPGNRIAEPTAYQQEKSSQENIAA